MRLLRREGPDEVLLRRNHASRYRKLDRLGRNL